MTLIFAVNLILSSLTVAGQAIIIVVFIAMAIRNEKIAGFFGKNAVVFSFIVAVVATLGSLFYSEIAGYEPCKLCWFQRILMYPQVILLGLALWKKRYLDYQSIVLSIAGAIIAGYHYLLQVGFAPVALPCSAVGYSGACSARFVMQFGYITIPMMAFTAFILIAIFFTARKFLKLICKEKF